MYAKTGLIAGDSQNLFVPSMLGTEKGYPFSIGLAFSAITDSQKFPSHYNSNC